MSSAADQPDPKEATEAQLCAYLEGELSDVDRSAIERHLAEHPQHRRLLADLGRARQWVRDLPREPAPADVAEAFQQQVERSMLLGDVGPDGGGPAAGRRWPQVALVAALVLLTVGLAVVVTLIVAGPGRRAKNLALDASPSLAPVGPTTEPDIVAAPVLVATPAPPPSALARRALSSPALSTPPLATSGPTASKSTVDLVVTTPAPAGVDGRVRTFFDAAKPKLDAVPTTQASGGHSPLPQARSVAQAFGGGPSTAPADLRFVGHSLSGPQVRQLAAELSASAPGQTVRTEPVAGAAPATGPATFVRGQTLTVVVPQLSGPGVAPTNVVRVADDGTIALPMIDPVPAAGATAGEVERRVAERYRHANLIPAASVTVESATTRPAVTRPTADQTATVRIPVRPAATRP